MSVINRKSSLLVAALSFFALTASVGVQAAAAINGTPATSAASQREIKLDAKTKWVNVQRGETVRFVTEQSSFAWTFDTLRPSTSFDLAEIAPQDGNAQGIKVYVSKSEGDRG